MKYWQKIFSFAILVMCILTLAACGLTAKKTGAKKNKTIVSAAQPPVYTLTVKVNNSSGGRVEGSPYKAQYPAGTKITLEAIAADGWSFERWDGTYYEKTNSAYEKEKITLIIYDDIAMKATFTPEDGTELVHFYSEIAIGHEHMGSVIVTPKEKDYKKGSNVVIEAIPNEGYEFDEWVSIFPGLDPADKNKNPLTVNINGSLSVINATFKFKEE